MAEPYPLDLTPGQLAVLEKVLRAGFRFGTLERITRNLAVEKEGFIALLDPAGGKLSIFGQVGYRMGDGVGMLVERGEGKAFVQHGQIVEATPELLAAYDRFRAELTKLLEV